MKKGLVFVAVLAAICYGVGSFGSAVAAKAVVANATSAHQAAVEAAIGE